LPENIPETIRVLRLAFSCHVRKNVIDAEENSALGQVHQQGNQIAASSQELLVLPLANVVHADVRLGPAGHAASEFRAHKKVCKVPEFFRTFYRVMIGKGEQIHPTLAELCVQLCRVAVALSAEIFDKGGGTGSGKV
jgi:hypothetical protein